MKRAESPTSTTTSPTPNAQARPSAVRSPLSPSRALAIWACYEGRAVRTAASHSATSGREQMITQLNPVSVLRVRTP